MGFWPDDYEPDTRNYRGKRENHQPGGGGKHVDGRSKAQREQAERIRKAQQSSQGGVSYGHGGGGGGSSSNGCAVLVLGSLGTLGALGATVAGVIHHFT